MRLSRAGGRRRISLGALTSALVVVSLVLASAGSAAPVPATVSVNYTSLRVFSPNGDGSEDSTDIYYCLDNAANLTATVENAAGATVRTLARGVSRPEGCYQNLRWDGVDDTGAPSPDGAYVVRLTAINQANIQTTAHADVDIDRRVPGALTAPSPGARLSGQVAFAFRPADGFDIARVDFTLSGDTGSCSAASDTADGGLFKATLDIDQAGCGSGAKRLYAYVQWIDRYDNRHYWQSTSTDATTSTVTVDSPPDVQLRATGPRLFSPNDDGQEDSASFAYCAADAQDGGKVRLRVVVTDANGATVRRLVDADVDPQPFCYELWYGRYVYTGWDGTADDGTAAPAGDYQIEVEATDSTQLTSTTDLPVTIDRRTPGHITAPARSATLAGTTTLAFAPDRDFSLDDVSFSLDNHGRHCSAHASLSAATGSWSADLDTSTCGDGAGWTVSAGVRWTDRFQQQHYWSTSTVVDLDNPAPPQVEIQYVSPLHFSPDGDGQEDATSMYYCVTDELDGTDLAVRVDVVDASGTAVRSLADDRGPPQPYCYQWYYGKYVVWDGTDDDGAPVADGRYRLRVTAVDATGLRTERTSDVLVDRRAPGRISSPAADASLADTAELLFTPTPDVDVRSVRFTASGADGYCAVDAATRPDGVFAATLAVAAECGDGPAQLSAYVVWVDSDNATHGWSSPVIPVKLDNPRAPSIATNQYQPVTFSPNGDGQDDIYSLNYCAMDTPAGGAVRTVVRVLDGAGRTVRTLADDTADPRRECGSWWYGYDRYVTWDGADDDAKPVPDGNYTVRVDATDPTNRSTATDLTVTVDRRTPGTVTTPRAGGTLAGTADLAFTPAAGVDVRRVDLYFAGVGLSIYNASPDGVWRTTYAVGDLPPGPTTLTASVTWVDASGVTHGYSTSYEVAVDPTAVPLSITDANVSGSAPLAAAFTVRTSDPDGRPVGVSVVWGDGSASERTSVSAPYGPLRLTHTYGRPGSYTAFVSVDNGEGGYASQSVPVVANGSNNAPPTVTTATTPTTGVAPMDVTSTVTATDPDGDPLTYRIDFGDGSAAASGSLPTSGVAHRYAAPGTYLQRIAVSDGQLTVTRFARITVSLSEPLSARAGDDLAGVVGTSVRLDGSQSRPAAAIGSYHWDFGDGQSSDDAVSDHLYVKAGTYKAVLTVRAGSQTSTSSVTVSVTRPPQARGLTLVVTSTGGAALGNADVVVVRSDGVRVSAVTDGSGSAFVPDLPDGAITAYASASGYIPDAVACTVTDGRGSCAVSLDTGDPGAATLDSHRMTIDEIQAAGIDVTDPENVHVYEAEVHLYFDPASEPAPVEVYVSPQGVQCAGDCTAYETPGCSPSDDNPCYALGDSSGGSGGGGGGGDYGYYPSVSYVAGEPFIHWLVLPIRASFLKEFFNVSMIVQNLTRGFTFTQGAAALTLPGGLGLASTATPQALTQPVPDVAGGTSKSVSWVVRGDVEGSYDLQADYTGNLEPLGTPVLLRARTSQPLEVYGASALRTAIVPDCTARRNAPYNVEITVSNVTSAPVYNMTLELLRQPPDVPADQATWVPAPGVQSRQSVAVVDRDHPFTARFTVFPALGTSRDPLQLLKLQLPKSFVQQVGGDVDLKPDLSRCNDNDTGSAASPINVQIVRPADHDIAHLTWLRPTSDVVSYDLYARDRLDSRGNDDWYRVARVASNENGQESFDIPSTATSVGRYYAVVTNHRDGRRAYEHTIGIGPSRYVSLGDSYSSGEGVPDFEPGSASDVPEHAGGSSSGNKCHRSDRGSYGRLLLADRSVGMNLEPAEFHACSGAVSEDVLGSNPVNKGEPAQLSHVNEFTNLITLTMGGNDIGFGDVAFLCVVFDCALELNTAAAVGSDAWLDAMATMWQEGSFVNSRVKAIAEAFDDCLDPRNLPGKLLCNYKRYKAIKAANELLDHNVHRETSPRYLHDGVLKGRLASVYSRLMSRAPNAHLVVTRYPQLVSTDGPDTTCGLDPAIPFPISLGGAERVAVRNMVDTLNEQIEDAANAAVQQFHGQLVVVNPKEQFDGHELCQGGRLNENTYFNSIVNPVLTSPDNLGPVMYSFHPNSQGQQAFERAIAASLPSPSSGPATPGTATNLTVGPRTLKEAGKVLVERGADLVVRTFWRGSTVTIRLTSPDGTVITPTGGDGVTTTPTSQQVVIRDAPPGEWQVAVFGDDVPADGEPVDVDARAVSPTRPPLSATATGTRLDDDGGKRFALTSSSSDATSETSWLFSDGKTATGDRVQHTFTNDVWWATAHVTDADGRSAWATVDLGGDGVAPSEQDATLVSAAVGVPYRASLPVRGRPAPALRVSSGQLPPGLDMESTGQITGTPTASGHYVFDVAASNALGDAVSTYVIDVRALPSLRSAVLPAATLGMPYRARLDLDDSTSAVQVELQDGQLPAGLGLAADGTLTGTPKRLGQSRFTVALTTAAGSVVSGELVLNVTTPDPATPRIASSTLAVATYGVAYRDVLRLVTPAPARWQATTALPTGLTLDATGVVYGVPKRPGSYVIGVRVVDSRRPEVAVDGRFRVRVQDMQISPRTPSKARVGTPYRQQLRVVGGLGTHAWALVRGNGTPRWLTMSRDGVLGGVPTRTGSYGLTVAVTDSAGRKTTVRLVLVVTGSR